MRNDLAHYVSDVTSSPVTVKVVSAATTGLGLNELFGWIESGVAFAATAVGLMVTLTLWKKLRLERREVELRIQVLENQLKGNDDA